MITISSIAVAPAPLTPPQARVPADAPAKPAGKDGKANTDATTQTLAAVASGLGVPDAVVQLMTSAPVDAPNKPKDARMQNGGGTAPDRPNQALTDANRANQANAQQAREAAKADTPSPLEAAAAATDASVLAPAANAQANQTAQVQVPPNAAAVAMDKQVTELLPNLWKASRKAVDVLIGEEAMAAAQRAAQVHAQLTTKAAQPNSPEVMAQASTQYQSNADTSSASSQVDKKV